MQGLFLSTNHKINSSPGPLKGRSNSSKIFIQKEKKKKKIDLLDLTICSVICALLHSSYSYEEKTTQKRSSWLGIKIFLINTEHFIQVNTGKYIRCSIKSQADLKILSCLDNTRKPKQSGSPAVSTLRLLN